MGRNQVESQLQGSLLLTAPRELPDLRLFRRNVGKAKLHGHVVHFALPGQCDLYGLRRGGGHIEIELKAYGKSLSPEQREWQHWCQEWGVPHLVLKGRQEETVKETVERWCLEIRDALP